MTKLNWIAFTILNLIASVVIPAVLGNFFELTPFESWAVGGIIFLALGTVELLGIAKDLHSIRMEEHRIWSEKDHFSALLISIRTDFQNMCSHLEGEDSTLIRQLITQRVQKLRDDVHTAAEAKELYVSENHGVDTSKVMDLFRARKARVYRDVIKVLDDKAIFDVYGRSYFKRMYDLSQSRDIEGIKALIVVEPTNQTSLLKAGELMCFYTTAQGYEARAISKGDFEQLHKDSGLEQCEDFGLYGDVLLFRTIGYDPNHGEYSYDSVKIRNYMNFFDACWKLPRTFELPAVGRPLSIDEVVKL